MSELSSENSSSTQDKPSEGVQLPAVEHPETSGARLTLGKRELGRWDALAVVLSMLIFGCFFASVIEIVQVSPIYERHLIEVAAAVTAGGAAVCWCWTTRAWTLASLAFVAAYAGLYAHRTNLPFPGQWPLTVAIATIAAAAAIAFVFLLMSPRPTSIANSHATSGNNFGGLYLVAMIALGVLNNAHSVNLGLQRARYQPRPSFRTADGSKQRFPAPNNAPSQPPAEVDLAQGTESYWQSKVLPYIRSLDLPGVEDDTDEWLRTANRDAESRIAATYTETTKEVDPQLTAEFQRLVRAGSVIETCARRRKLQTERSKVDGSLEGDWLADHPKLAALASTPPDKLPGELRHLQKAVLEQEKSYIEFYKLHVRLAERYPGKQFPWPEELK